MIIKKYRAVVVSILTPLPGISTLEFESCNGKFKYLPGQFLHLALDKNFDGTNQWPDSRCFSMQSSPDEDRIKITYAVKGNFTTQMKEQLVVGSEVWVKLPYGTLFTQPHEKNRTVFIAGGTGITPFLSLFTHHSFKDYISPKIYLGFRSKEFNIYEKELEVVKLYGPKVFIEDIDGLINIDLIFSENGLKSNYFISGPPSMIKSFKQFLIAKGVKNSNILTDEWE